MHRPHPRAVSLALAGLTALALASCSTPGDADSDNPQQLTTLNVATIGLTSDGSLITGIEQGFFAAEGIAIETQVVANPPAGLAAAQSGQVDVAYSPSIPLLNALSQGVPLQIIGAADGYPETAMTSGDPSEFDDTGFFAAVGSDITTVADLAGATIAVPARGAQLEVVIAGELADAGIDPATGVNWVVLDFTSAVEALKSGTVDAAGLVSPFTSEAATANAKQLSAPSVGFFESGATGLWVAGSNVIETKGEAIAAFQRAIVRSNQYATEHPNEAIQAGLDYTDSQLSINDVKLPVWPSEVRLEDIQRPNEKMVKLGFLPELVNLDGVIVPTP